MIIIFYNLILEVDSYISISGSNPRIEANFLNKIIYYDRARYASVINKKNRRITE